MGSRAQVKEIPPFRPLELLATFEPLIEIRQMIPEQNWTSETGSARSAWKRAAWFEIRGGRQKLKNWSALSSSNIALSLPEKDPLWRIYTSDSGNNKEGIEIINVEKYSVMFKWLLFKWLLFKGLTSVMRQYIIYKSISQQRKALKGSTPSWYKATKIA